VLLAEDNEINTEIAVRILRSIGLQVDRAENGKQAVELFGTSSPGQYRAVLMDIQMPVMNGYGSARAIRALSRPDAKRIPIIAMTADAFEESVREAKEAGMDEYVTKPIEPQKLFEALLTCAAHGVPENPAEERGK
jgi:two-component system sensor histidine kinase/response regulator